MFASAVHGYAFSLDDFANLWAPKISMDKNLLLKNMFSDSYLSKSIALDMYQIIAPKEIKPDAEAKGKRTIFEQLVLQPLWEIHKYGLVEKKLDRLKEFSQKLSIPPLKSRRIDDAFDEFMRLFLPLTSAVVKAIAKCKSPKGTFSEEGRILNFVSSGQHPLYNTIRQCDPESELTLIYVAKLLKCDERKVAMCRILSGKIEQGNLFIITDKM